MKNLICLLAVVSISTGCFFGHKAAEKPAAKESKDKFIISPEPLRIGRVVNVNVPARFAVINYPVGNLPANGQVVYVYRRGLKVGELKVTGPHQDDNTVADITHGDVQMGDELRAP